MAQAPPLRVSSQPEPPGACERGTGAELRQRQGSVPHTMLHAMASSKPSLRRMPTNEKIF